LRKDATKLEDGRLAGFDMESYPWIHERHRIFPEILEPGRYKMILDVAAGMGIVAKRIKDGYPCRMLCNDISETSLKILRQAGLETTSFDLDDPATPFPFADKTFDAVISLATLEHILHLDEHMREVHRVLKEDGHLFISTPNYNGIHFVIPFLLKGRSFHDPMKGGIDRYEFYAHVRYFTYVTLLEFISSFGFRPDIVYLPLPAGSARYRALQTKSKLLAFLLKNGMHFFYRLTSPRWALHPVMRFSKIDIPLQLAKRERPKRPKKIIL
jgi:SAM-dependent methyltransferase